MKKTFNVFEHKGMWYGKRNKKFFSTSLKATEENRAEATKIFMEKLVEYENSISKQTINHQYNGDTLISDYILYYIEKQNIRPTTKKAYVANANAHIVPYFKKRKMKIKDCKCIDADDFVLFLRGDRKVSTSNKDTRLKKKTIREIGSLLKRMFDDCVRYEFVDKNPFANVKIDTIESLDVNLRKEEKTYTQEEIIKLLEYSKNTPYYTSIVLLTHLGLRRGEVLNLRFSDIEKTEDQYILHIRNNVVQTDKVLYDQKPKTKSSERDIVLPQTVVDVLLQEKKTQESHRKIFGNFYKNAKEDIIVRREDGSFPKPNDYTEIVQRLMKNAGIRVTSPHFLRHTFATTSILMSKDIHSTSKTLGHSSIRSTEKYAHETLEGIKSITYAIADVYSINSTEKNKVMQTTDCRTHC